MKKIINVVEDEKDLNELVKRYLEKEGYIVNSYLTFDEAYAHLDDEVDLWVLDIMLDDKSGFDLIEEIKSRDQNKPVIFMSARDKEFDLLMLFVKNRGTAFLREQILEKVWDDNYFGSDRVVDDTLRRLRKKMPKINIQTIYGFGYRLS